MRQGGPCLILARGGDVRRTSWSYAWRRFASFMGGASDVATLTVASWVSLSLA